jgi:hypothetical protein
LAFGRLIVLWMILWAVDDFCPLDDFWPLDDSLAFG